MEFHGEAAIRLFDVGFRRTARQVENLVVILLRHLSPWSLNAPQKRTAGIHVPAVPLTYTSRATLSLQAFLRSLSLTSSNSASSTSSLGASVWPPDALPSLPVPVAPPALAADCSYIFCSSAADACSKAWVLVSISSRSSPLIAVLTAATAAVAVFFSSSEIFSPTSLSAFSTVWMVASALLRAVTSSRNFLSSSA